VLFTCSTSEVYEIDPATGNVLNSFPSAQSIHGIAWDGRYLIQNGYNTGVMMFTDKETGAVAYSQPSPGGYGIAWGKWDNPSADQYLWISDFQDQMMYQTDYYTGLSVLSFPTNGGIGAAWDGSHFWDSNWSNGTLQRYDPNTGMQLNQMAAAEYNPRDICWDGHYMWTVHQSGMAHQYDVWGNAGLYPVTVYLNPRYIEKSPGDPITLNVSLMNHTEDPIETDVWFSAQRVGSTETYDGQVYHITLCPGAYFNVFKTKYVPGCPGALGLWDLYIRCGDYPEWDVQDGVLVEVID
jgi:hypothetical protein